MISQIIETIQELTTEAGSNVSPANASRQLQSMNRDITQILSAIEQGDPSASSDLLLLVYEELRRLASSRMNQEKSGQTLQPTALVHEAFIRLVGDDGSRQWDGRGHFFAAAAEAMRRILIEHARRKGKVAYASKTQTRHKMLD